MNRRFTSLIPAAVAALHIGAMPAAFAGTGAGVFDIVGLRLGMTPQEARSALLANDPGAKIEEERRYFVYSDGINHGLRSEDFLHSLSTSHLSDNRRSAESLTLDFSPKPTMPRVVGIHRIQDRTPNPPTGQQYRDALVTKYGKPLSEQSGGVLRWEFPAGKSNCMQRSTHMLAAGKSILIPIFGGIPAPGAQPVFARREFKDLSQCASYLEYAVGAPSGPANDVRATMVDVEATARGELAANEWLADLKDNARRAREAKGKAPTL